MFINMQRKFLKNINQSFILIIKMVIKFQKQLKNVIIEIYHHFPHIFKEINP